MYPGTIMNWHDQSEIDVQSSTNVIINNAPLFLQVFSSDKGPEDLRIVSGDDFDSLYGTMSFTRHGQSAIQAKNIIAAGGRLLAKRVVASDSTLANAVLVAKVTDSEGSAKVTWSVKNIENCKSFDDVKTAALKLLKDDQGEYPVIVYADNGRGVSDKAVRLNPDYTVSKTIGKTFYTLAVYEGSTATEKETVSFDPTVVYSDESYHLNKETCDQIDAEVLEDVYELYLSNLSKKLGIAEDDLRNYDLVYGYTNRGKNLDKFVLDPAGVDLDSEVGIKLKNGSNGVFGDAPVGTSAWTNALKEAFDGTYSQMIYDVDTYKVAAIVDANYPDVVKNAIADLVNFRQDCVFFRDFGTGLKTFLEIKAKYDTFADHRSRFIADYCTSYSIKDPNTMKNIEVTMTYDLASCLVNHLATNAYAPVAGIINGFVLPNAIRGTINFTPIKTPSVNQKDAMEEIRVNYAIFQENQCVVQTCYTSQEAYTQLSYVGNVIAIQNVMRAVRAQCPKTRYNLSNGDDLSLYATAVNTVLSQFANNFSVLNFTYTQDNLKSRQKIFYASIQFAFRNWAQTEIFDLYAINNGSITA